MNLPAVAILSELDGTLIDSKASVVAAFRWWAQLRRLASDTVGRIPFGRTSTDAAAVLAPHLDAVTEEALLDRQQEEDTRGSHGKPNPEPYLRGAEALQVAAAECVVLEDAPSGVQSAYRDGMRVIGILSSCTREQLSEASVCIGSLRELPKALAALGIR